MMNRDFRARQGAPRPARIDRDRAAINAWNQHGVPRRTRVRNRRVGGGGRGWAGNQQEGKVRAPRPAVCPCRRRQARPIGCLAQDPSQHAHLAGRHQLPNLAAAGVELGAVLVGGVGGGSHDSQQLGNPNDRLTGQPYVHLDLLRLGERDARWACCIWRSAPWVSSTWRLEGLTWHSRSVWLSRSRGAQRGNQPPPRYSSGTPSVQAQTVPHAAVPTWQVRRSPARGLRER